MYLSSRFLSGLSKIVHLLPFILFLESEDSTQYCWGGGGNDPYTFGQVWWHCFWSSLIDLIQEWWRATQWRIQKCQSYGTSSCSHSGWYDFYTRGYCWILDFVDMTLTQSVAIMEYINDTNPEAGLIPGDPAHRAKVRMVTEIICSGIQPIQNLSVMNHHSAETLERQAWSRHWITTGFMALEKMEHAVLVTCPRCSMPRGSMWTWPLTKFHIIFRLEKHLSSLPQFVKAHPTQQPDCPDELLQ